ncbi:hypothetical protein EJ04DRAFT_516160 [Polyplosphaeria fusca]|uniref:MOSC domain-containing protein n=1 Tax=Polyplosphaeria fusca TaxID=682080 RepID=A0A9P4QKS6_9PLEO|nr:hypothetical protein EJ04DRAFT_516160 [Polyplosphaeria fusca]
MPSLWEPISQELSRIGSLASPPLTAAAVLGALTALVAGILFYTTKSTDNDIYEPPEKVVLKVEELWHYPIKGLGGIKLDKGTLGPNGFEDDRTFCLQKIHRDAETGEIKVWETMYSGFHFGMVLFQAIVEDREKGPHGASITVTRTGTENPEPKQFKWTGKSAHQIRFPLRPDIKTMDKVYLDLHGSATDAYDMGKEVSDWFSGYLGFETKVMYIGTNSRIVRGSGAPNSDLAVAKRAPVTAPLRRLIPAFLKTPTERITFHDIGQYLVVTKESNDQVSSRFSEGINMDIHKFRPNIIVSGAPAAYDEDYWARIVFPGHLKMDFGGTCWRCQAITVDQSTGQKAEGETGEVWKKLMKDRRVDKGWKYGPVFGKYSYTGLKDIGREINVGDEAVLTMRIKQRPIFDWPLPKAAIAAFSG